MKMLSDGHAKSPLVVSYGMGLDSTAMLVGMAARGIRPDAILFADTGSEKVETYSYLGEINAWLVLQGFPQVTVVNYQAKDFKHWPEYYTLEENCLTNGTLPSEAFGFGSCSQKWKHVPQNKWCQKWAKALDAWSSAIRVTKAIGYDCTEEKRSFKAANGDPKKREKEERLYRFWYPLQEWGWDRARCAQEVSGAGLPIPVKSSCFFCPNMTKPEVKALPRKHLQRIVLMEARALPRLEKIKGLWRTGCKGKRDPAKKRPGRMTDFIRDEGLLEGSEIERIERDAPKALINRNERAALGEKVDSWAEFFVRMGIES